MDIEKLFINKLLSSIENPKLWLLFAAAFALGTIGAVIHRATQDPVPPPPGPTNLPPGDQAPRLRLSDALVGGVAAIATLYVTNPQTAIAFVGGSLVAGYAGKLVLAGLEARATAALAQLAAAQSSAIAATARADLDQLADRVTALAPAAEAATPSAALGDVQRLARDLKTKHVPA